MGSLGIGGGFGWKYHFGRKHGHPRRAKACESGDGESTLEGNGDWNFKFPLKPALTAASLALTGDTIAQITRPTTPTTSTQQPHLTKKDAISNHDWLRALRMAAYGFLLYGPGSHAWYQLLDSTLPKQTLENLTLKVILNQVVLGPCVIAVIFAWNNLWIGRLSELPKKYQNDALPTLFNGFKFWIPVSVLNFGL
ncbi:PXMP2/4 family protein 4 [Amborella trichopoda]|uniref:PXMP2/4 family protein 4 n=1 Tax=Amborella trichopoda TaxID=13333 RepID=UPI0009BE69DD|nr:PXMP2/4 family protein 4 [Amborella trichopoda]|eukprot:XP_020517797.1 PXMP2/4 family protein 4 [Amborella trichopoda]